MVSGMVKIETLPIALSGIFANEVNQQMTSVTIASASDMQFLLTLGIHF